MLLKNLLGKIAVFSLRISVNDVCSWKSCHVPEKKSKCSWKCSRKSGNPVYLISKLVMMGMGPRGPLTWNLSVSQRVLMRAGCNFLRYQKPCVWPFFFIPRPLKTLLNPTFSGLVKKPLQSPTKPAWSLKNPIKWAKSAINFKIQWKGKARRGYCNISYRRKRNCTEKSTQNSSMLSATYCFK